MITIVNANSSHLNNITINIPTQKLIVFSGPQLLTESLTIDIIYSESQNRFAHLATLHNLNWSCTTAAHVKFIAGLMPTLSINFDKHINFSASELLQALVKILNQKLRGILCLVNIHVKELTLHNEANILSLLYKIKNLGNTIIINTNKPNLMNNAEHIVKLGITEDDKSKIIFQGSPIDALKLKTDSLTKELELAVTIDLQKNADIFNVYDPLIFENISFLNHNNLKIEILYNRINTITGFAENEKAKLFNLASMHPFNLFAELYEISVKTEFPPDMKTSGLMPSIGINDNAILNYESATIGKLTQLDASFEKLFDYLNCDNIFGLNTKAINAMNILDLLQEFRKQVVIANAFSIDAKIQRSAQIMAGAVINVLDILEKLAFGYTNLNKKASELNPGELTRIKLASAIAKDLSGICFVIDEPSKNLAPEHLDNLFFMLYELKRQGNTVLAFENNEDFIAYSDHVINMK